VSPNPYKKCTSSKAVGILKVKVLISALLFINNLLFEMWKGIG
jgi:hypothetical protein